MGGRLPRNAGVMVVMASMTLGGCFAAKQPIPLDCIPREVSIYVDGELLEGHPDSIALAKDEPHKLFFKRPGHEPELLIIESLMGPDGKPMLSTADACVDLVPVGVGRELTIEGEDDASN